MANYWFYGDGQNTLSGSILNETQITEFLLMNRKAREDFQAAFDLLEQTDKDRISEILDRYPHVKTRFLQEEKISLDKFQRRHNTAGIFFPKPK